MKIKQLIKKLQKFDENLPVVVASDMEGNSFSFLTEVYFDKDDGEPFEVDGKMCKNCVILFPSTTSRLKP